MIAVFFSRHGLLKVVPLVEQRTVTANWYCTSCLPAVFEELKKRRPKTGLRGIHVHHDNASAHTAARTLEFLAQNNVQLVSHPPYSQDLAPCDFFLFPRMKNELRGQRFSSSDEAVAACETVLSKFNNEMWHKCFDEWFSRMHKCIAHGGCYFEKQ
jgi:histone-lysine N-methyltransferase SETMAR